VSDLAAKHPDSSTLQNSIDTYMTEYDEKMEKEKQDLQNKTNRPDEDGFTLVQRKLKRTDGVPDDQVKAKANKAAQPLQNFYKFQQRDAKRDQLAILRKKFEEDKERIARLKKNRKFRPY